jgi:hypothetical protein
MTHIDGTEFYAPDRFLCGRVLRQDPCSYLARNETEKVIDVGSIHSIHVVLARSLRHCRADES